jgi:hypothetical protein
VNFFIFRREKSVFDRIYRIYTVYLFKPCWSVLIVVYFKLLIPSTKYAARHTHHEQTAPCKGDFSGILATSYVKIRIIYNIFINGEFRIENEEP